nr:hypothetical protein [Candidatus Sigynarchaeum springense]MDO8116875.1 hypothetical protein [Candidatus Sigynarchaeota archaeon]
MCFIQGRRKRNSALLVLSIVPTAFGISVFLQAIAYMILVDAATIAMVMKELSVIAAVVGYVFVFMFLNYVWFERMRISLLVPVIILATLEIASMFLEVGIVPLYFSEGGTLVATSLGKSGYLQVFETIFANVGMNLVLIAYWTKSYVKAPSALKRTVRALLIYIWLVVCANLLIVGFFFSSDKTVHGYLNLFMYGLQYLVITSGFILIIALAIRDPRLLFILPFRVDRLLVIYNNSGLPLYEYQFSAQKVDGILFSGLIQGLQQLSVEVLQKGQISQIILESGVLTFRKMNLFTVGLLASRNSQILTRSFHTFTIAFERQFTDALQQFKGERSAFDGADRLVHEYFGFVPTSA